MEHWTSFIYTVAPEFPKYTPWTVIGSSSPNAQPTATPSLLVNAQIGLEIRVTLGGGVQPSKANFNA
jgi:hypothetical protein